MGARLAMVILVYVLIVGNVLCLPIQANNEKERERSTWNEDEGKDEKQDVCLICRDDFLEQPAIDLLCGHKYHLSCLEQYMTCQGGYVATCCLCKRRLTLPNNEDFYRLFQAEAERRYKEERDETVRNKLKLGLMASITDFPEHWLEMPAVWHEPGVYFGSYIHEEEDEQSIPADSSN